MTLSIAIALLATQATYPPVKGIAIHYCSCNAPCPCMFSKGKDMDGCRIAAAYHFSDGGYIGKDLGGLNMVVVSYPPELEAAKKDRKGPDAVVYLPSGVTSTQERNLKFALVEHQCRFAWMKLEFRKRPIQFRATGGGYSFEIPGVLSAKTLPMKGADDRPITVDNVDFQEGSRWSLGVATNRYTDPSDKKWRWNLSNRNGSWTKFSWDRIDHP